MGITRPTGEQLRFRSATTGDHILDTYMENSEKGSRTLPDLMDDLFDSSGVFRSANFEFRFNSTDDKIQFRAGNFANSNTGWTDVTTFFDITGTFNASTTYNNFDLLTLTNKDVYIVHGLSSGTTFADEAAVIASANTQKLVDVSEARDWASKTDGQVVSTDYSSKAYAVGGTGVDTTTGSAKDWAIKTSSTVGNTGEYSAKYWATSTSVTTVSSGIANINTVAAAIASVNTTAANISNVNTVAGISADVTTVANIDGNVTTVAGISADTTTVAGIAPNVTTVAGVATNVTTVAGIASNVTTVANNNTNVTTVATNVADLQTVADEIDNNNLQTVANDINAVITAANDLNEATSEIDTVANSIANVDLVGGSIANVNTVATNIANVNTTATNIANVNTVAGISANVTTVANISADVTTAATNVTAFNNTYLGAQSSAPTQDPDGSALDLGDLYFDTTSNTMKVYSSSGWTNAGSSVNGTADRFTYTATASQTTFTGADDNTNTLAYDAGFLDVYMNGVKLVNGSDFTATSGSSIVLASGAALNDTLEIIAYGTFTLSNQSINDMTDVSTSGVADNNLLAYNSTNSQFEPIQDPDVRLVTAEQINLRSPVNTGKVLVLDVEQGDVIGVGDLEIYDDRTSGHGYIKRGDTSVQTIAADTVSITDHTAQNQRAAFTSTGLDVTGTVTADSLTVQATSGSSTGVIRSAAGSNSTLYLDTQDTSSVSYITASGSLGIATGSGTPERMRIANNGVVSIVDSSGNEPTLQFKTATAANYFYIARDSANGHTNFVSEETGSAIRFHTDPDGTGPKLRTEVTRYGDVKFYDDDGSTPSFTFDASDANITLTRNGTFAGTDNTQLNFFHYNDSGNPTGQILVGGTTNYTGDMVFKARAGGTSGAGGAGIHEYLRLRGNERELVINNAGSDNNFRVSSLSNSHMLFVDAGGEYVNVNTSITTMGGKLNVSGNKGTGSGIPSSQLVVADVTALREGGGGAIQFNGIYDSNNSMTTAGSIEAYKRNATSGDYGFGLWFKSRTHGGSNQERLYMDEDKTVFNDISANTDFRVESDSNSNMLFVDASGNLVCIGGSASGSDVVAIDAGRIRLTKSTDWNIESGIDSNNGSHIRIGQNGSWVGSVTSTTSGTTYNTTSDRRLKDNIEPIADATDKLMAMNPVSHRWKADPDADAVVGFIAQEMQEIVPEAVSGDPDGEEMMSMDYGRITPVLVAALQDATNEIKALKERVAELEAK